MLRFRQYKALGPFANWREDQAHLILVTVIIKGNDQLMWPGGSRDGWQARVLSIVDLALIIKQTGLGWACPYQLALGSKHTLLS